MIYITNDQICHTEKVEYESKAQITYGFSFAQFKPISCLISASVTYSSAALKGKRVFSAAFREVQATKVRIIRTNKNVSISLLKRTYYTR